MGIKKFCMAAGIAFSTAIGLAGPVAAAPLTIGYSDWPG